MLSYTYEALQTFCKVFSRHSTWLTCCLVVLGFLGATHIDGISSFCRFWSLHTPGYLALLHFFRSSAWSLTGLCSCWGAFVLRQNQHLTLNGRAVLLGDHTMTSKAGRLMPGVVTRHQESGAQVKSTYFLGHVGRDIGVRIARLAELVWLQFSFRIHQRFTHLRQPVSAEKNPDPSATRLVQMALDLAVEEARRCSLVLG